jgi:hypothetical protein
MPLLPTYARLLFARLSSSTSLSPAHPPPPAQNLLDVGDMKMDLADSNGVKVLTALKLRKFSDEDIDPDVDKLIAALETSIQSRRYSCWGGGVDAGQHLRRVQEGGAVGRPRLDARASLADVLAGQHVQVRG